MTSPIMILPFAYIFPSIGSNLLSERTFFGITSVSSSADGQFNLMRHGTTVHGAQRIRDEAGNLLTGKPEPVTYYHNSGPLARSFFASKSLHNGTVPQVAIVGLGTGSMLCHGSEGENWSTYEIDNSVVEVASNPKFFNYISDCGINPNIVVGDARITLADEPKGKFDYLMIDAFSSDSVPVHLLTREAIDLYFSRLNETGMLVFHLSNRYMELPTIVGAFAKEKGFVTRLADKRKISKAQKENYIFGSTVVAVARNSADLGGLIGDREWIDIEESGAQIWTDGYSNVLAAIWRKRNESSK